MIQIILLAQPEADKGCSLKIQSCPLKKL